MVARLRWAGAHNKVCFYFTIYNNSTANVRGVLYIRQLLILFLRVSRPIYNYILKVCQHGELRDFMV